MIKNIKRQLRNLEQYLRVVGIRSLFFLVREKITKMPVIYRINRQEIRHPIFLRVPSSDVPTFQQVFLDKEYDFAVKNTPKIIVDAGANIGLASVYFANKFPDSKIFAIEPENGNLAILRKNVAPYKNITVIPCALWHENTLIDVIDNDYENWGFMMESKSIQENRGKFVQETPGMTIGSIMEKQGIEHIDILKIDIEGAEYEVFRDPSSWIEKVDAIIIELHDRIKPGCSRGFYCGTNGFDHEWLQGENVFLTRSRGCVIRD